jgi:hypothetical protein
MAFFEALVPKAHNTVATVASQYAFSQQSTRSMSAWLHFEQIPLSQAKDNAEESTKGCITLYLSS